MRRMTMSTVRSVARRGPLRRYYSSMRQRAEGVVLASAERTQNLIAALAPYDRQELDDFHMVEHIQIKISPGGLTFEAGFSEAEFASYGQPPYFIYTEFGTTKMSAQPCVFPARDIEAPTFEREMAAAMQPRPGDTG